jgi:hypothetical protein
MVISVLGEFSGAEQLAFLPVVEQLL